MSPGVSRRPRALPIAVCPLTRRKREEKGEEEGKNERIR